MKVNRDAVKDELLSTILAAEAEGVFRRRPRRPFKLLQAMRRQDDPPLEYDVTEFPDEPDLRAFQPPKPVEEQKKPLIDPVPGMTAEEIDRKIKQAADDLAVKMTRDNLQMLRMVGAVNDEKIADLRAAHHDPVGYAKKRRLQEAMAQSEPGQVADFGDAERASKFDEPAPRQPRGRIGVLRAKLKSLGVTKMPLGIRATEDAIADREAELEAEKQRREADAGERPAA